MGAMLIYYDAFFAKNSATNVVNVHLEFQIRMRHERILILVAAALLRQHLNYPINRRKIRPAIVRNGPGRRGGKFFEARRYRPHLLRTKIDDMHGGKRAMNKKSRVSQGPALWENDEPESANTGS